MTNQPKATQLLRNLRGLALFLLFGPMLVSELSSLFLEQCPKITIGLVFGLLAFGVIIIATSENSSEDENVFMTKSKILMVIGFAIFVFYLGSLFIPKPSNCSHPAKAETPNGGQQQGSLKLAR